MAQQQLGLTFRVPTGLGATNEAATHPATNVLLATKWRRTVRSTSTGAWNLDLDFGSSVALDGLFIHFTNFAKVQLAKSDNGSSWTNLYAAATDVPLDDRCTPPIRRKGWLPASGWLSVFNNRYLRITPSVADAGATYWELGAVACPVLENMTRNWGTPFQWQPVEAVTRLAYAGGAGSEVNVEGPTRVRFSLQGGPWAIDALPQLRRLRALGQDGAFFLYENRGNTAHAYLLKRVTDTPFAERTITFDAGFEFEECV
jgi:hypothetical protein